MMYSVIMRFSWDPKKAAQNLKKHRVSFEEAATVFFNILAKLTHDPDHSEDEERFILIGHSEKNNLLFVVHIYRENEVNIHIISARKATPKERKDFEEL